MVVFHCYVSLPEGTNYSYYLPAGQAKDVASVDDLSRFFFFQEDIENAVAAHLAMVIW